MLPENIASGGDLTLIRVVGSVYMYAAIVPEASGALIRTIPQQLCSLSIQLQPVRQGLVSADTILDLHNASDLDSNAIIWRRQYCAQENGGNVMTNIAFLNGDTDRAVPVGVTTIDSRVKRRFDRSQYRLSLCITVETADAPFWGIAFSFRGLFLTSGGI